MHASSPCSRSYFNPRPPRGERLTAAHVLKPCYMISIHALREESDVGLRIPTSFVYKFQSTPSARRATSRPPRPYSVTFVFQSTPSARRATDVEARDLHRVDISIHALREESDTHSTRSSATPSLFQSTPSARRATSRKTARAGATHDFNPRPPRGERPRPQRADTQRLQISIHALREESDGCHRQAIHQDNRFQSTPSARRATFGEHGVVLLVYISIHALREESDRMASPHCHPPRYFNPRPPRGERQQKQRKNPMLLFHYTRLCTI